MSHFNSWKCLCWAPPPLCVYLSLYYKRHLHDWSVATDSSDKMVRALLLDYRKAFDLIDHHILLRKLGQLGLPEFIVSWVGAFLHGRQQRVRVEQSVSEWLPVNGGVPQGTRVGPIVFLFIVNDLLEGRRRVKFVDGTASWECCHVTGRDSSLQDVANDSAEWSKSNKMQLNVGKTKMIVTFSRKHPGADTPPLKIKGRELERISCAKVLGVMISNDLSWAAHVDYICPNTNRRLYFVCMLRRACRRIPRRPPHLLQGVRAQCRGVRQRCVAHWADWGAGRPYRVCPETGSAHHRARPVLLWSPSSHRAGDAARPPGEDGPSLLRGDPQPRPQTPPPAAGPEAGEL